MPRAASALSHFATLVRKYRELGGHRTARAFYDAQGGRESLGIGYKAYANVERGVSVPQPALVERLVAAFRLALSPERSREFALAYLRVLLGFDEMLEFAVQVLGSPGKGAPPGPRGEPVRLSAPQSRVLKDPCAHAVLCALSQDQGRWRAEDLAAALRLDRAPVETALAALAKAGLASRDAPGRYAWPFPGRTFLRPEGLEAPWPAGEGELLLDHPLLVRARESELRGYLPYLAQCIAAAELYGVAEKGADTALFSIEASVVHLLSF